MTAVNPDAARGTPDLSRRARLRHATKIDLVAAARALLVEEGLTAVTVRAVASRLGMTAPAIYRYYDSRELLLEDVVDLLYAELADHLEAARDSVGSAALSERFLVTSRAFRSWALQNRPEFGLLFGAPVPGVGRKEHDFTLLPEEARGVRFMLVWLQLFLEIPAAGIELPPWPRPVPAGLRAQLSGYLQRIGQDPSSVDSAMLFLVCWQTLYGFICTEAFGHLEFALDDGREMFEDRLQELRERLHLP